MLVTHAWHMQRAEWAFKAAGLQVTAAPTGFNTLSERERRLTGYLPSAKGLYWSSMALHERLGYFWYRWRYPPEKLPGIARITSYNVCYTKLLRTATAETNHAAS